MENLESMNTQETPEAIQDATLLENAATADTVSAIALDRQTASGYIAQGIAFIQSGERLISQALQAGAYDALYRDDLGIFQELIDTAKDKVDAVRGIERAMQILCGAVRREKQTGIWYFDDTRCLISIDKTGNVAWRERYRDSLARVREDFQTRFYGRSLKSLNGLIKEPQAALTRKGILQHIAKVEKAEFKTIDRAFLKGYLEAVQAFIDKWEREEASVENHAAEIPTTASKHGGKPRTTPSEKRK